MTLKAFIGYWLIYMFVGRWLVDVLEVTTWAHMVGFLIGALIGHSIGVSIRSGFH